MIGKLMVDSGWAQRIALILIDKFREKRIQLAVVLIGFVLLLPLVFTIAEASDAPLLYIGIPIAALSATYGFLPPHLGPTDIAAIYKVDLVKTLLYGLVVAIPAVILVGLVFTILINNMEHGI